MFIHMKAILLLSLATWPALIFAQDWRYEAPVTPKTIGYQDVMLPAQVTARLARDHGNMRLLDSAAHEVPYILQSQPLKAEETSIQWMQRYEDDYWERWYSRSFFQNPKGLALDRIALKIRNADVHQDFWLSGSDDMNRWYIIKEDYGYDANYDPQSTWNLLTIHFPRSDYKYFKVEIRHYWREPIQIMGAGYYTSAEKTGNAQAIPDPKVTQREEGSRSVVDLHFDAAHYFDEVLLEVDGPELYLRQATLQRKNASGIYEAEQEFQLSSKTLNVVELEQVRATDWRLVIENKDDKPIRIAGVQARQRKLTLTAKLNAAERYRLLLGAEDLRAPEYDLSYFRADLPKQRAEASIGAMIDLSRPVTLSLPTTENDTAAAPAGTVATIDQPIYKQPWFLWVGIGLVVVVIGGMSMALLKDMKKEG
jgi:hypothetical protein